MKFCLNTKIIEPDNKKENIDYAIILLHGYGGDGQDISMLTLGWKRFLKNTVFLCPDARESCAVSPSGYQWFDLSNDDPKYILEESKKAEVVLLKFLERIFSVSLFAFEKDFNFSLDEYSNMNNS